jgi:hypothetical protein
MCGPTGVANASLASQRFMHQQIAQVHQFANRTATIKCAIVDGGNAGTVIAAIFKPF